MTVLVGQNVKYLRKARHLTQMELKSAATMTVESLRKIEKGAFQQKTIVPLNQIANALHVDIAVLFSPNIKEEELKHSKPVSVENARDRIIRQIKFRRKAKQLSQAKLDEEIHEDSCIVRLEKRIMYPSIRQLEKIASYFGIETQMLFGAAVPSVPAVPLPLNR